MRLAEDGPTVVVEFRHQSWLSTLDDVRRLVEIGGGILVTDPLKMSIPDQPLSITGSTARMDS